MDVNELFWQAPIEDLKRVTSMKRHTSLAYCVVKK